MKDIKFDVSISRVVGVLSGDEKKHDVSYHNKKMRATCYDG